MIPKDTPAHTLQADDAPDLSTPEWKSRFSKVLLRSARLEGVNLERVRDFDRDVLLVDDGAPLQADSAPTSDKAKR